MEVARVKDFFRTGVELGDAQWYAVLAPLCDGAALDLVQNSWDSVGLEVWRALTRRFDPQGADRRRDVMSWLLQPGPFDPKGLNSVIAKREKSATQASR